MLRDDDFGGEATQYPLFWVKYSDLEPYLNRQTVMTSNLNNAATMSVDDYFTTNKYSHLFSNIFLSYFTEYITSFSIKSNNNNRLS